MRIKFTILSLIILSTLPSLSEELRKTERTCRLVFPEKPGDSPEFVYLYDGKENHRVYLSAVNFSDVVKIARGNISLIMTTAPISDPENIRPEYPRVSIPETIQNFYIFLSVDEENKVLPLRMNLINLDSGKFKPGHTLWYNFTDHRIAAKLGQTKMSVDAKGSTISEDPLSERGYYRAEFIFQPQSAGDFRKITEQQWWFDAKYRYVGFIADRGGRLPRIYFFRDFRSSAGNEDTNTED